MRPRRRSGRVALRLGFDERVHAAGIGGRDRDADAAEAVRDGWESGGELLPGVAAVGGFEKTAAGAGPRAVFPGALARGPQHGVDGARVGGIEREVDRAGVFVFVEHLLPGVAAIGGAEDAALGVGAVGVAEHGREEAIGIARIDEDARGSAGRRAVRDGARCGRRRWICRFRRRPRDRGAAGLRRWRHK